ncbi:T. brucei spp.-specific protein [Trypanosoma brucei gambiense DAL972]|uniref:T. brucei spp.-specific protein n=1 Tax=Trypanosoma brucei gambiense (strain MHOM/CI/86/DAL972) TaxID=679716 RepID=D0A906_TRYB9|nr:T. brucei spp.-specific protein [Trypanosoma brucei gambiense DAL972]CBH18157.1 T. brucei spp.-specific protein [Trypanosoma brucei gambiense DAL972]|eukprot:XP_011780421.1 T. brucei spp.-specific protein [Trypanosoma brucei gambiense DAL972]
MVAALLCHVQLLRLSTWKLSNNPATDRMIPPAASVSAASPYRVNLVHCALRGLLGGCLGVSSLTLHFVTTSVVFFPSPCIRTCCADGQPHVCLRCVAQGPHLSLDAPRSFQLASVPQQVPSRVSDSPSLQRQYFLSDRLFSRLPVWCLPIPPRAPSLTFFASFQPYSPFSNGHGVSPLSKMRGCKQSAFEPHHHRLWVRFALSFSLSRSLWPSIPPIASRRCE